MPTFYQKELDFTVSLLRRMRLDVRFLHPGDSVEDGLSSLLGVETDYQQLFSVASHLTEKHTIYTIQDPFLCHYIYFHLPADTPQTSLVIGPYLTIDPSEEIIMELSERLGLSRRFVPRMFDYYAALPVFHDPAVIMTMVSALCEVLFGGPEHFNIVDVNDEARLVASALPKAEPVEQENVLKRMAQLEERYAYENKLMDSVSKGLVNQAELMMSSVSQLNYQSRAADPLRNMKNYCIICNTLLRKAAQNGGVHPLYLDQMSGDFARRIEHLPTVEKSSALIGEMIRAYCRLVRTHTGRHYSAVIQKTLAYIDSNLSDELSLSGLAKLMQISPGYLSTLFHRETGQTLAQHINARRMRAAMQLLTSTKLQIQTVAQLTGFADPNYFGKQFKRFYGITPLQCKKDQLGHPTPDET